MHKKSLLLLLTQPKCSAWVDTLRLHSAFVHTDRIVHMLTAMMTVHVFTHPVQCMCNHTAIHRRYIIYQHSQYSVCVNTARTVHVLTE